MGATTVLSSRTTRCSMVSAPKGRVALGTPILVDLPPHKTERFLNTPLPNDPEASLSRERLDALVAEYHRQRGREPVHQ